jgi:hypothetical protein
VPHNVGAPTINFMALLFSRRFCRSAYDAETKPLRTQKSFSLSTQAAHFWGRLIMNHNQAYPNKVNAANSTTAIYNFAIWLMARRCLTKKAEPPPTRGVNRDSGTDRANGGWLRRLVRRRHSLSLLTIVSISIPSGYPIRQPKAANFPVIVITSAPLEMENETIIPITAPIPPNVAGKYFK